MRRFAVGMLAATMVSGGSFTVLKAADDTTSADKTFIADSAQDSLAEINFAKLALEKSSDANVKKFAARMVKDHGMLITSMKPLAKKYDVKLPTGPSITAKAKYELLKVKSGSSFDHAYVEAMVDDHHDDLKKFMDEEMKTSNADVKAAVTKGAAVIKEHTMMIDELAQKGGIKTPPMPNCKM